MKKLVFIIIVSFVIKPVFPLIDYKEIAYDLHSSREVISRLLKALEIKGRIKLNRASVEVLV